MDESNPDVPGSAQVVDCTVVKIGRPKQHFRDAKIFFSGKHGIYALKKEVCVNVRSGTAAMISPSFPGSVHDITILRSHARQLRDILGERALLADLGYRGAERDVPTLVICGPNNDARRRRVIIECYFGRLKCLWAIFARKWSFSEDQFDAFLTSPAPSRTLMSFIDP